MWTDEAVFSGPCSSKAVAVDSNGSNLEPAGNQQKSPDVSLSDSSGLSCKSGGGSWIRTSERSPERIYSPRPLATWISHLKAKN